MVKKFTDFPDAGVARQGDKPVGTRDNSNVQLDLPGSGFADVFGNFMIGWESVGTTGVNYIVVRNAATGDPVLCFPVGTDSNISMLFTPKGEGDFLTETQGIGSFEHNSDGTGDFKVNTPGGRFKLNLATVGNVSIEGVHNDPTLLADSQEHAITEYAAKQYIDNHRYDWLDINSSPYPLVENKGYLVGVGASDLLLPATSLKGDLLLFQGVNNTVFKILPNSVNQFIHFGSVTTTAYPFGYLLSLGQNESIILVCTVDNLEWAVLGAPQGYFDVDGLFTSNGLNTTLLGQSGTGAFLGSIAPAITGGANIDNLRVTGNDIEATDLNGNVGLVPDGTGRAILDSISYPKSAPIGSILFAQAANDVDASNTTWPVEPLPADTNKMIQFNGTNYILSPKYPFTNPIGSIIYANALDVNVVLPIGNAADRLTVVGGFPAWNRVSSAEIISSANYALTGAFATITGLISVSLQDFTFAGNTLTYTGALTKKFRFVFLVQTSLAIASAAQFRLAKNGAIFTSTITVTGPAAAAVIIPCTISALLDLSTGNTVVVQGRQSAGSGTVLNVNLTTED